MAYKRYDRELSPDFGSGLSEKRVKQFSSYTHGYAENQQCPEIKLGLSSLGLAGHSGQKRFLTESSRITRIDSQNPVDSQNRDSGNKTELLTSKNYATFTKCFGKSIHGESEDTNPMTACNIRAVNTEVGHIKSSAPLLISTRSFSGESRSQKLQNQGFSREQKEKHLLESSGLGSHSKVVKDKSFRAHSGHRVQVVPSSTAKLDDFTHSGSVTSSNSVLSRLIASKVVDDNEIVRYLRKKDGSVMKEGRLTHRGVLCTCCHELYSLSNFEAHAGSKLHRPAANMFLADGRSLADCQSEKVQPQQFQKISGPLRQGEDGSKKLMSAAKVRLSKEEVDVLREGDIICGICANGGQLICCDGCPSTFHQNCLKIEELPDGHWFCYKCKCAACGGLESTRFGVPNKLFLCNQCDLRYHTSCCKGRQSGKNWFCEAHCEEVFVGLQSLVNVELHTVNKGLSWSLLRPSKRTHGKTDSGSDKTSIKLGNALNVLKECFHPIIDLVTKKDIMANVLYSRRSVLSRLDFRGFYTFILEHECQIVCAATIRFHGAHLAEMPFIGTPFRYRRQGMCRVLVDIIEKVVCELEVKRLVLPALPGVEDTWINSFGFQPVDDLLRHQLLHFNIFPMSGVKLLYKSMSKLPESPESGSLRSSLE